MATYYLRNSLNPDKVVKCIITVTKVVPKDNYGEPVWVVETATEEPHKDTGDPIAPAIVHWTEELTLDDAIREATEVLAEQIDWGDEWEDSRPIYVYYHSPEEGDQEVSLYSNVVVSIKDNLPGHGIDKSTITMTVNGYDVTNDLVITGDPFDYTLKWNPPLRVEEQDGTPKAELY